MGWHGVCANKWRRRRRVGVRMQRCGSQSRGCRASPNPALPLPISWTLLPWPSAFQSYSSLGTYCIVSTSYQQSADSGIRHAARGLAPHAHRQNKPGHEQQRQGSSLPVGPLPFLNFLHRGQGTALGGIRTTSLSGCNTFAVPGHQIPVESARTERERQVGAIALYCGAMGVRMRMAATKMSAPRRTTAEKQERPGRALQVL